MIEYLGIFLLAALETAGPADATAFSRYQLILDKKPFGFTAEATAKNTPAANANQPPLANGFKLVALEKDDESGMVKAGIVDAAGKKSYYLTIGEEEDGLKLVDADFAGDRALIHKGDQEEWLAMGSGSSHQPAVPGSASDPNREIARRQRFREMMAARQTGNEAVTVQTNSPAILKQNEMRTGQPRRLNLDLIRKEARKNPPLTLPPMD